jgi:hypothetical protein
MTEFGAGNGFIWSSRSLMNDANNVWLKEPLIISTYKIPWRDMAGRMEYLHRTISETYNEVWNVCTICHA